MCVRNEKICGEEIDHACHFLADSGDTPSSLLYACAWKEISTKSIAAQSFYRLMDVELILTIVTNAYIE